MIKAGDILSTKNTRITNLPVGTKFVSLSDEQDGIVSTICGNFSTTNFNVVKKNFAERVMYLLVGD